jgi:sterol desaturase/sphingolipid hydroxylase (fatty acid hydroxylase superfamily)
MLEALRGLTAGWPAWALDLFRHSNGLLLLVVVFVPLERVFALRPQRVLRRGWGTDTVYYFLSSLLPPKLVLIAVAALLWALHGVAPQGLFPALHALPTGARLALSVAVAEVGFYWGHRAMHRWPALWRFHAVHHSAEQMDWLVNTRGHPVDLVLTRLCGLLPLYALGLARPGGEQTDWVPLLVALLGSSWGYLIHANVRWRFGPLEQLVATPAFHHRHHEHLGADGRGHGNYAALLPLVDRLFGTWRAPGTAPAIRYGTDEPVPAALLDQLMGPFMGQRPGR